MNKDVLCSEGAKIAIFDQDAALASITAEPLRVVNISTVEYIGYGTYVSPVSRDQQPPPRRTSVNLVYGRHRRVRRREQNRI